MDFLALAQQCAPSVAPATMAAIVKTESQFRPHAININGPTKLERQPASREEAVVTANWLIAKGYNIDMGLGQINSKNLPRLRMSVEQVFDPCNNLAAAASILSANYQNAKAKHADDQQALYAALSAYNTGNFVSGFNNGYVQKIIMNAGHVVPAARDAKVIPIGIVGKIARPGNKNIAPVARKAPKLREPANANTPSWDVFSNASAKSAFDSR